MSSQPALFAFLDGIGGPELLLVLVVVLIFFGGEKLPEFAKGMGKALREFKKAAGDVEQEFKRAMDDLPDKNLSTYLKPPAAPIVPHTLDLPATPAQPALPPADPPVPPGPPGEAPSDHGIEA